MSSNPVKRIVFIIKTWSCVVRKIVYEIINFSNIKNHAHFVFLCEAEQNISKFSVCCRLYTPAQVWDNYIIVELNVWKWATVFSPSIDIRRIILTKLNLNQMHLRITLNLLFNICAYSNDHSVLINMIWDHSMSVFNVQEFKDTRLVVTNRFKIVAIVLWIYLYGNTQSLNRFICSGLFALGMLSHSFILCSAIHKKIFKYIWFSISVYTIRIGSPIYWGRTFLTYIL